jgi:hypothetical protein
MLLVRVGEAHNIWKRETIHKTQMLHHPLGKTNVDQERNKNLNGKVQNHKKLSPPPSPA